MAPSRIPVVADGRLTSEDDAPAISIGDAAWFAWLDDHAHVSFSLHTPQGAITVRRERKRNTWYWYAYHTVDGSLRKKYLGKSADLTTARLDDAVHRLTGDVPAVATPAVRVGLMGTPIIQRGDATLPTPAAKGLVVLGYLAAHGRPVARQQLLALLWPDSNEQAAQKNLRNTLWYLRRAMGANVVEGGETLVVGAHVWIDSRELERPPPVTIDAATTVNLEAAVALYRGEYLEGVTLSGTPDAELWIGATRERLRDLHLRRLHALARSYQQMGSWDAAIATARMALAHDALQEPMVRLLMEAYARQGDRSTALRHYDALRETLDRELGVTPLPETDALRDDILRGGVPLASASSTRPTAAITRIPSTQPFVGRDNDLTALDEHWATASTGRGRVVMLHGEAGIGKSRLWRVWSRTLGNAGIALQTRSLSTTQHLPFAPLVDLVRQPVVRERLAALSSTTPPQWVSDLARLVPELRDAHPVIAAPLALPPAEEQRHIFEALFQALVVAPRRPVALFIDDLHWADRATLDWMGYAAHRAERMPLLLVGAYRTDETSPPLARLMTTWGREGILDARPLARLSRDEASELIATLAGPDREMEQVYEQSAGNPFFLLELLRAEPGVVPSSLTDLIANRLQRLSAATRQVLHAAAVLGDEMSFALLQHTSGRTDDETLDAIDALVAAELLVEDEQEFTFSHPLIAFVVDQSLSGPRRVMLHRRAAATLVRLHPDDPGIAGRLARHYREAQDAERAARYAEQAGDAALAVSAPQEAAHFFAEALALAWTPARAFGYGRAMYRQGELASARPSFEAAMEGYERAGDDAMAARAALDMALTFFADNNLQEVVHWAQRGRDYLRDAHEPRTQALAAYLLGAEMRLTGRSAQKAADYMSEAVRLIMERDEPGLLPNILIELGNARAEAGDLKGAIAAYRDLVMRSEQSGNDFMHALGYNNLAYHLLLDGDPTAARATVEAGIALAHERDLPLALTWLHSTSGEIALAARRWDDAIAELEVAAERAERWGNAEHVLGCRINIAVAHYGRGDRSRADRLLRDIERTDNQTTTPYQRILIAYWRAVVSPHGHETPRGVLARASRMLSPTENQRLQWWLDALRWHATGRYQDEETGNGVR